MVALTSLEIQSLQNQPEGLLVIANNIALTRWFNAVALTLLVYDTLLTLADEFQLNWTKKFGPIRVLLVVNRILSLGVIMINGWVFAAFDRSFTDKFCAGVLISTGFGALVAFGSGNWILLSRTKVLLGNKRVYNYGLDAFFVVIYGATTALCLQINLSMHGKVFYSRTLTTCGIVSRPGTMGFVWIGPVILETVIFLITLVQLYQKRASELLALSSRLILVLHRDGIYYYLVIVGLRIYLLLSWMILPISGSNLVLFPLWSIMSIAATRLQYNLARAAFPDPTDIKLSDIANTGASIDFSQSAIDKPRRNNSNLNELPELNDRSFVDQWEMSRWGSSSAMEDHIKT